MTTTTADKLRVIVPVKHGATVDQYVTDIARSEATHRAEGRQITEFKYLGERPGTEVEGIDLGWYGLTAHEWEATVQ